MNNDIIPPRPPSRPGSTEDRPPIAPNPINDIQSVASPVPLQPTEAAPEEQTASSVVGAPADIPRPKRRLKWVIGGIIGGLLLLGVILIALYFLALSPIAAGDTNKIQVTIKSGSSSPQIGKLLEDKKVIRNKFAFDLYARIYKARNKLQAGTYSLSPTESTAQIVQHLVSGNAWFRRDLSLRCG